MKRRQGFTIVELLVSMALILFIMAILSQAFMASMTAFRNAKAAGDMANKLRATTQLLQRDLSADHFEAGRHLSDPNFWMNGPPQQGFFQVYQGTPSVSLPSPLPPVLPASTNYIEGYDLDGIGSYLSTTHSLAFTIHLRGNGMGDFLSAGPLGSGAGLNGFYLSNLTTFGPPETRYQLSPGGSYNSQWAEVAWFLQPSINPSTGAQDTTVLDPESNNSPAVPLYKLYRRQRLLVPDNYLVPPQAATPTALNSFLEMSCWTNVANASLYFNNPMDVTVPLRRFGISNTTLLPGYTPISVGNGTLTGSDIQLTDVVSFDVRLLIPDIAQNLMSPPFNSPDPFVTLFNTYPSPPAITPNVSVFAAPPVPPLPSPQAPNPANNYLNTNTSCNTAFNVTTGPMVFDTWSSLRDSLADYSSWNTPATVSSIPLWNPNPSPVPTTLTTQGVLPLGMPTGPIIQAIQITIRIWDAKTNQTRQVTIVQAM